MTQKESKKIVIFGTQDFAQLAKFYLDTDSDFNPVAFAVHKEQKTEKTLHSLPVVDFESIEKKYPPNRFKFFAPLADNKLREQIYKEAAKKGYEFISYISSKATVLTKDIGKNCFILEDNTIQPFVKIGDNVIMWSGNHIGHHSIIKPYTFFSSHVVLSGHCTVKPHCWFGVNSTIRDGLTIAEGTFVAMSACLTKNTEPWALYQGIPAKKVKNLHELDKTWKYI